MSNGWSTDLRICLHKWLLLCMHVNICICVSQICFLGNNWMCLKFLKTFHLCSHQFWLMMTRMLLRQHNLDLKNYQYVFIYWLLFFLNVHESVNIVLYFKLRCQFYRWAGTALSNSTVKRSTYTCFLPFTASHLPTCSHIHTPMLCSWTNLFKAPNVGLVSWPRSLQHMKWQLILWLMDDCSIPEPGLVYTSY